VKEYWQELEKHREFLGQPDERTEGPDNLTLIYRRKKEDLDLALERVPFPASFLELFGDSLSYLLEDVASGDDNNLKLDLPGFRKGFLDEWLKSLSAGAECRLVLIISKNKLIGQVFNAIAGNMLLYFYSESILEILDKDLQSLEQAWFKPGQKFFLLLGDRECTFVGPVLHVFGGATTSVIRGLVYDSLLDAQRSKLITRLQTRSAETRWQDGTRFLLPEYLNFQDKTAKPETRLKPRFNKHLLALTIASIANYTHSEGTSLISLFEGQKRVEVKIAHGATMSDEVCNAWFKIYDWTYTDHTRDKLAIIRNLVTLQPYDSATHNYAMLTSSPDAILQSAPDLYDKFIGDSIKQYFDKLKDASTYVQSKIDSVGQQVTGLVDTFTKNLLATAGFLIGTVLSKLIDPNLSKIYPLLVKAFLVYMGVILLVYYPLAFYSYRLTCREYNHSLSLYKRSFTESDLQRFVGRAFFRRRIYFWVAFVATALVHIALIVSGYYLLRLNQF
jgi:hypothetical protein